MPTKEFFEKTLPLAECVVEKIRNDDPCQCTSQLDDTEIRSIYFYTTESDRFSYKKINQLLANESYSDTELRHQIYAIDSGLSKLNENEIECYRGEESNGYLDIIIKKILDKDKLNIRDIEFNVNFFMSTSVNNKSSHLKKKINYVISTSKQGKYISHLSAMPDEREVLFKRNSLFYVSEIDDESVPDKILVKLMEVAR